MTQCIIGTTYKEDIKMSKKTPKPPVKTPPINRISKGNNQYKSDDKSTKSKNPYGQKGEAGQQTGKTATDFKKALFKAKKKKKKTFEFKGQVYHTKGAI